MLHIKLAQFAVRCALPPRISESPVCANDNKPSCVLQLLDWFIGSRGFSSLERRPKFWVLQHKKGVTLCSKSFKLGFSSTWTKSFQMYKLGLEKAQETEIKLPTFVGSYRKQGNSKKSSTSASLPMLKCLTVAIWLITTNCGRILKDMVISDHFISLVGNLYSGQKAAEVEVGKWTSSKLARE